MSRVAASGSDIDVGVDLAVAVGQQIPLPGAGHTAARWSALTELAGANITGRPSRRGAR